MKLYLIYFRINEMALRAPLILSTHDAPAWSPGPVVSRAGKIVISGFFASSFVRNNIYFLIKSPPIARTPPPPPWG